MSRGWWSVSVLVALVSLVACSGGSERGDGAAGSGDSAGAPEGGAVAADRTSPGSAGGSTGADAAARDLPCRCAQRTLAEYYAGADEVMMGRLVETSERDTDLALDFEITGRPWKVPSDRSEVGEGDQVELVTAQSSASCGIEARVGAVYAIFAHADPDGGPSRLDSCSGTRVHLAEATAEAQGFDDVPGPFVVRQLDALSGMDVLGRVAASAPRDGDPDNTSLLGLLDLAPLAHGGTIDVRERPDSTAPVTRRVGGWVELDGYEVGYEVPAVAVVGRVEGWYRIRFADETLGWIPAESGGTWFPYEELPVRSLAYLTGAWTGHVWPDIGAGIPARSPRKGTQEREEYPVEVHESRRLGGTLWFRVDVLDGSPCEAGEVRPELSGWVPAYGPLGEPTAWYYSRGC
jgi:hypothetical protein